MSLIAEFRHARSLVRRRRPQATVSLTLNTDLVEKARAAGLNLSRVAEAAIAAEFRRVDREQWIAEWQAAVRATDAYVAEYGLPFGEWGDDDYAADADAA